VLARSEEVTIDGFPFAAGAMGPSSGADGGLFHVGMTMAELEHNAIFSTLEEQEGNRTRAAKVLGISLRTLQRKLKEYGVTQS